MRTGVPQHLADDREPSSMRRYCEEVDRRFWLAEAAAGRPDASATSNSPKRSRARVMAGFDTFSSASRPRTV